MICITHGRDLDGWASGAIVKHKYPQCKIIEWDYGQPIPWESIPFGEHVFMTDISFPMEDMQHLSGRCGLTWIDHHISAINQYNLYHNFSCRALLDTTISACEATWKHLFPDKGVPVAIQLLGEYDTWRYSDTPRWEEIILPFQYGMRLRCSSVDTFDSFLFNDAPLNRLLTSDDEISLIIEEGKTVIKYQRQIDQVQCKKAWVTQFFGFRALVMNGSQFSSLSFKSVYDESLHDIMMVFQYNGAIDKWVFSIYTTNDIDCSAIAKAMGGGGHAKAAGFELDNASFVSLDVFHRQETSISREQFIKKWGNCSDNDYGGEEDFIKDLDLLIKSK